MWILVEMNTELPEILAWFLTMTDCMDAEVAANFISDGLGNARCIFIPKGA